MSGAENPAAAERQRRYRARRRRDLTVFPVALPERRIVEWLLNNGRIGERESEDREAVAEALARVLRENCALR